MWLSQTVKGFLGLVFFCINSLDALVASSVVDNPGMMRYCGKNSTTYVCLSPCVICV